jgi:peptidoglycan/xylan/chitin deacetylase (PgdA/CDA1 family)
MIGSAVRRAVWLTLIGLLLLSSIQISRETDVLASEGLPIVDMEKREVTQEISALKAAVSSSEPIEVKSVRMEAAADKGAAKIDSRLLFSKLAAGDPSGGFVPKDHPYRAPDHPTVYITFDDGPSKWTPKILDILKEHDVKATFFMLGKLAEGNPHTAQRIVSEGHAVGNHSYDHKYKNLYSDFLTFWDQVQKTDEILSRFTGQPVRLLRAPGGTATNFDAFYFYYLQEAGYLIHDWTVDSGDSKRRNVPAAEIINNVKKAKLTHEVNLLLHDSAGHKETVKALPEIISYYKSKGYQFAALTEQVKPVAFRVGRVKWNRSMTEAHHDKVLTAIQRTEAKDWVPLREWAQGKGNIAWDPATETATVAIEGSIIEIHIRSAKVVQLSGNLQRTPVDLPFRIVNDRIQLERTKAESVFDIPKIQKFIM